MSDGKVNSVKNVGKILFANGSTIVEILLAALIFLSSVAFATYIDAYSPYYDVPYVIMMTGLIPVAVSAIIRHVNKEDAFKLSAQIFIFAVHTVLVVSNYLFSTHFVVLIILVGINLIYALICTSKPPVGKIKSTSFLTAFIANLIFYAMLTYFDYDRTFDASGLMINAYLAFLIFIVARQLNEFEVGYHHSMKSSMLPIKEISKQNTRTTILVILGFGLTLLLLFVLPIKTINNVVAFYIRKVLRKFFLMEKVPEEELEFFIREEAAKEKIGEPVSPLELKVILGICIAAIAIFLVVKIIRLISERRYVKEIFVESNSEVTDVIEKIDHGKSGWFKANNFGTGYEMKIRKKFYKKVRKSISKGANIKASFTPNEITKEVNKINTESITELKNEYERVRYK